MSCEVKIVGWKEGMEGVREVWEPLQWNPYGDLDYVLWKYAQPECTETPYVLLVHRQDRKPVILAGEIRRMPIQFQIGYKRWKGPALKTLSIQRYGVMGRPDEAVWQAVRDHLEELLIEKEIEAVVLLGFDVTQAPHTLSFARLPVSCTYRTNLVQEHWFVECPQGLWAHKKRHRSFWNNVRNARNRILRQYAGDGVIRSYREPEELAVLLAHTEQIARRTWQRRLGGEDFTSDGVKRRFSYFASRGFLRARILYLGGEPAAFLHGLEAFRKHYIEVMGYDPQHKHLGVGTYLTGTTIEDCLDRGLESVDLGVGNSEAKRLFCDRFFPAADLFVVAPTARLKALNTLRISFLKLHLGLKRALSKGGLYHMVRSLWRYGSGRQRRSGSFFERC